ncbi:hypothetical protein BGW80DRAFT_911057 [Lactifluus volemus]|nr:hypothetical protein BGW80DRAFT_911057 [Lactifluus volemus]
MYRSLAAPTFSTLPSPADFHQAFFNPIPFYLVHRIPLFSLGFYLLFSNNTLRLDDHHSYRCRWCSRGPYVCTEIGPCLSGPDWLQCYGPVAGCHWKCRGWKSLCHSPKCNHGWGNPCCYFGNLCNLDWPYNCWSLPAHLTSDLYLLYCVVRRTFSVTFSCQCSVSCLYVGIVDSHNQMRLPPVKRGNVYRHAVHDLAPRCCTVSVGTNGRLGEARQGAQGKIGAQA